MERKPVYPNEFYGELGRRGESDGKCGNKVKWRLSLDGFLQTDAARPCSESLSSCLNEHTLTIVAWKWNKNSNMKTKVRDCRPPTSHEHQGEQLVTRPRSCKVEAFRFQLTKECSKFRKWIMCDLNVDRTHCARGGNKRYLSF